MVKKEKSVSTQQKIGNFTGQKKLGDFNA